MRIGEILDRALKLLPKIVLTRYILVTFLLITTVSTLLQVSQSVANSRGSVRFILINTAAGFVVSILTTFVTLYLMVLAIKMSSAYWEEKSVNIQELKKTITIGFVVRVFLLWIRVFLVSCLWMILFIIPGIIYWCNRLLAGTILVLENGSISGALERSKKLMTFYPNLHWWSFGTPFMRISGILLLLMILGLMPGILLGPSIFSAIQRGEQLTFTGLSQIILLFVSQLLTTVFQLYGAIAYVGFYYDLKIRSEGYDLELELREFLNEEHVN